jgi:hypothetical protein
MIWDDINNDYNEDETESQSEHLWYDYKLFPQSDGLQGLVPSVREVVDQAESAQGGRRRIRKSKDEISFSLALDSLVANLTYVVIQWGEPRPLIVSREKSPEADTNIETLPIATFLRTLGLLIDCGYVIERRGKHRGQKTTIEASEALLALIQCRSLSFEDFRSQPEKHLIKLKRVTPIKKGVDPMRERVSLQVSPVVQAMSDRVARLNAFLATADISFTNDGLWPRVDTVRHREMTRHFSLRGSQTIRFDQGGRLFGRTFWLNLSSKRRGGLRINGERVADLDFKNLGPRIGYAMLGQEPPSGDLYDLTGLLEGYDNANDDHRKAIKQAFASCLNGGAGGSRSPNRKTGKPGILAPLPKGTSAAKVRKALLTKHPGFWGYFERDPMTEVSVGYEIQFMESCILLCALERLKDDGVVALPFHDGLMVAQSHARIAKEALETAACDVLGVRLPVVSKPVAGVPEMPIEALAA